MDDNKNLIEETVKNLGYEKYAPNDVKWVGSCDGRYAMSWIEFTEKFKGLTYDAGFGGAEIAYDLVVVGDDWWLERHEYDGSEWWEFKKHPARLPTAKAFNCVTRDGSTVEGYVSAEDGLAVLNGEKR